MINTVVNVFTILSIATQSNWTWSTADCFAVFKAGHVRVAGVNGTVLDFNVAVRTSKTNVAVTGVVINKVNASTVPTWGGETVVDIIFASPSSITSWTDTSVIIDHILTCSTNARRRSAFVNFNFTITASVSIMTLTGVIINLIVTVSVYAW